MKKLDFKTALEKRGAKLEEGQEKFIDALSEEVSKSFDDFDTSQEQRNAEFKETVSTKIEEKIKSLNLPDDTAEQLRELGEKIDKQSKPEFRMNEMQKRTLMHNVEERKDEIVDAIKNRKSLDLFQIRAAAPHLESNGTVTIGTGVNYPEVENFDESDVIATVRTPDNFIFDIISNRQVAKVPQTRIKTEQAAKEGDVAVVAEASEKPLIQYKWVKNAIERKKYAGRIEWSEEFEYDNQLLFDAIVRMLERDVMSALNDGIYGDIQGNATSYTSSPQTGTLVKPNTLDVAVVLQSLINCNGYNADTVALNCGDVASLLLLKKDDGSYIVNPLFLGGSINGMNVIGTPTVASGNILVLDSSIYREIHSSIITRIGNYGDQFITNEFTMIAEIFSLLDVAQIDLVASYYGAIATIATDLTKV